MQISLRHKLQFICVALLCRMQRRRATTSMLNWIWDTWESVPYSHIKAAHFRATEYIYILWEQSRATAENAYGVDARNMQDFLSFDWIKSNDFHNFLWGENC